jgi:hypothetical protein
VKLTSQRLASTEIGSKLSLNHLQVNLPALVPVINDLPVLLLRDEIKRLRHSLAHTHKEDRDSLPQRETIDHMLAD